MTADEVVLQLAEARDAVFTKEGWAFELKLDGFRVLAERIGGQVRLVLRRGREATALFPEVAASLETLPGGDFIFDGELVIQDEQGHPIFQRLLKRSTLVAPRDIAHGAAQQPAAFFAFDVLMEAGEDLRPLPLRQRKARLLQRLGDGQGRVMPVKHIEREGEALLAAVRAQGLEGIVAKDLGAPYRGGRGPSWLKVALKHTADFAVVGYADDFNALYLATWDGHQYVYAGKVGSGLTPKLSASMRPRLEASAVAAPVCVGDWPREREARWCRPEFVVEVRYKNWPQGLAIREPALVRLREDKSSSECPTPTAGQAPAPSPAVGPKISNANKVLFPAEGITKGDIVAYYRAVSPWLLPYLKDRPLMLTRYPDGILGKSFFQKAVPLKAPSFVHTVRMHSEEDQRELEQIVCDDVATLEWCANLATLPFHIPASRVSSLERVDWAVIDFDPKGAPFEHVVTLAQSLHALCERSGLPSFVKTSGSNGLHVLVPLAGQLDHLGARQLAEVLAQLLVHQHPDIATVERSIPKRGGRVYIDALQNGQGKLLVAPYAVRALPGAPVSMPLQWSELNAQLTARSFSIKNALTLLEKRGDPLAPIMTTQVDLPTAIERLTGA